ncbi:MAG: hypothetical protein WB611_10010 [Stellaceae bacterium]
MTSALYAADNEDVLVGRDLVEFCFGPQPDERAFKLARKKLYAAAAAHRLPITKEPGIGLIGLKSTLREHAKKRLEAADRAARENVGMAPAAE